VRDSLLYYITYKLSKITSMTIACLVVWRLVLMVFVQEAGKTYIFRGASAILPHIQHGQQVVLGSIVDILSSERSALSKSGIPIPPLYEESVQIPPCKGLFVSFAFLASRELQILLP
jgi:hypothetical protein